MTGIRDLDPNPNPHDELEHGLEGEPARVTPQPTLADLSPDACARIVRYIVTSSLEHGVAPTAVVALYADLSGDELAVRYADQRFMLREVPSDWRAIENRVADLEETARGRGFDLTAAWRRASNVAMHGQDPLEQLARLAGAAKTVASQQRSIFDDPEDLDSYDDELVLDELLDRLSDREPDLIDLTDDAQRRIRRFAIEERLERGLPAVELLDLYRGFETSGDERARQYLDRVYVDRTPPPDWVDLQSDAGRLVDLAEVGGRDAGHMFADMLKASPGLEPITAMRLLLERLLLH